MKLRISNQNLSKAVLLTLLICFGSLVKSANQLRLSANSIDNKGVEVNNANTPRFKSLNLSSVSKSSKLSSLNGAGKFEMNVSIATGLKTQTASKDQIIKVS